MIRMISFNKKITVAILLFLTANLAFAQAQKKPVTGNTTIVSAGAEYKTSSIHQWLWGKNYRKEWAAPVNLPAFYLENTKGGLIPKKAGGGHQTQSLHLETKQEKEYTLRSVNKTLGKVIPADFQNTFIENIVNDKVSMSHPYGAAGVPFMAQQAGLFHTNPQYVYLPHQPALDSFNKKFGDAVYLFEQRVDGNWKDADNLGNFEKYISTDELLEKMHEDNDNQIDQKAFVKARLFDMFLNDWDRHEEQWKWGKTESKSKNIYKAVPQDRDQAFFNYNGVLLKTLIGASGLKYFQQFKNNLVDVKTFNYEERNLDRFFANELTLADWQAQAKELQQSLTDNVIETSVKQMPAEVYAISGNEIIAKLKARRSHIVEYATTYYKFIAKETDVTGSEGKERFEVTRLNDNETSVNIYKINKEGETKDKPFYSRTFKSGETKEIRLYGLSGNDVYAVSGAASNGIKVRLIGGNEKDSIIVSDRGRKVQVYDNSDNVFITGSNARLNLSKDSSIHAFKYAQYLYNKKGFKPLISYTNEDRIFVGLGYGILTHKWRKEPFASKQDISVRYSISQKAPSVIYNGLFPKLIGKWDLVLFGTYDAVRWTNFFGLGNERPFTVKDIDFYRSRTEEWIGSAGIKRKIGLNTIRLNGFYQSVRIINDTSRYVAKNVNPFNSAVFNVNQFAGGQLIYTYVNVNDSIVPTKGFVFTGNASYTQNIKQTSKYAGNFGGHVQVYVPLASKFSLALRAGAATVTGTPEFYQYAPIGGGLTMRGYRLTRFWGKTAFYNSNEFRFISKVRSHFFNGKAGLLAFFDNGRVWMPNETSDTWHTGYGGGILLSPFNKVLADITYGISKEESLIQLRFTTSF